MADPCKDRSRNTDLIPDLAIFLMSLHMSLQIFPPTQSILGHDGLYRIRYWVFAGWFIIPNFIVSLAFINRGPAFISQGGFCTLPIRPFWYRLALSWIPRYLFWVFVMGVAIRIYRHVGYEFKVFGMEEDHGSSSGIGLSRSELNSRPHTGHFAAAMHWPHANHSDGGDVEKQEPRDEELAPDEHVAMPALNLSPLSQVPRKISAGQDTRLISKSNPGSRRGSKHEVEAEAAALDTQNSAPLPATTTMQGQGSSSSTETSMKSASPLSPITEHRSASVTGGGPTLMQEDNVATRAIMKRRNAIQRQLRLLFIYPVVYLIMWVMPLVGHALNYSDYYAQHPIFAISLLALLSHCTMGFVDVCIFCWREKPWAHIPGADGTFWGSFKFWKFRRSWKQHRKSIAVHPNKSARRQTGAVDKIDSSSKAGGILQSITKRWSMKSKKQQQGSKFSQEEQGGDAQQIPLTTSPPPPPPRASLLPPQAKRIQHLRVNSGRSDRRILAAERAHERLALERAEFAERQQHKSWQGSEPSDRQQSPPPPREWWDRHMSIGDLDDHGLQ